MTDREMLEMAAKAAGMAANQWADVGDLLPDKGGWVQFVGHGLVAIWNPLTDDGDALRLAVKLQLTVVCKDHETEVFQEGECLSSEPIFHTSAFVTKQEATDPYAATRLAITRAAAAIGQAQEGDSNG